eukprot:gene16244-18538_t
MGGTMILYVFPIIGCITTISMFAVPLPSVRFAELKKSLGELNPLPWVAAFCNCLGYTAYGVILPNIFVFVANIIGLLLALYYSLSAVSILSRIDSEENYHKAVLVKGGIMFGLIFWSVLGFVCAEVYQENRYEYEHTLSTIGWMSALFAVLYYAAPLSTMFENASSLHAPMIAVNFVNALLWTLYGYYGINRAPIWLPNFIGVILALVQLAMIGAFGAHSGHSGGHAYRPVAEEGSLSPNTAFENYKATGVHTHPPARK